MSIPEGFPLRPNPALLVGLDGLDGPEDPTSADEAPPAARVASRPPLSLHPDAARRIRDEIARAGGREVAFLAGVDGSRTVVDPRAVARGNFNAVLAAARDAPVGGVMLHNHPTGELEPSQADLTVAAQLYEEGLGTVIVDNEAQRLYVVVEPPEPRETAPLDRDALDALLAPDGVLAGLHAGYEDRPGQREMLSVVAAGFNEGGIAVVEAGTGTGKSLAYLLPSVRWALDNRERTVVSTNTINLQEQLAGKDLPLVRRLLGDEVRWALIKGRGNYVSIRRAHLASQMQHSLFDDDRREEIGALLGWIEDTEDGSLTDLPFTPADDTWEEVRSDADACLRARCPHFQECFYQKARRKAAAANVLVVNHHLLFTDLAVRRATRNYTQAAVLPAYGRVVLDEAHNVEDAATSHLGVDISRQGIFRALARLERRGKGILTALHDALASLPEQRGDLRERMENRVRPAHARCRAAVEGLVESLEGWMTGRSQSVRLGGEVGEPAADPVIQEQLAAVLAVLEELARELRELRARMELDEGLSTVLEGTLLDLRGVERRMGAYDAGIRLVLAPGEDAEAYVRWLETRGKPGRKNLVLAAAPIELGSLLRDSLFTRVKTAVLTSATLTTGGSFGFVRGRLGLDAGELRDDDGRPIRVEERRVPSPFDYASQTLLAVPTDLPAADGGGGEAFDAATAEVVGEMASFSDGGLFVLFTSHAALRRVADLLRRRGVASSWPLFVHGDGHRHQLLAEFVEAGRGILLGTSSFWEGVDVPGDPLRGLILQKLPFRVPTEPITAARMEAVERAGRSAFQHFMLPHAALRLQQGFGRLIRSQSDRGAVVVLDDRLVTKRYGRYLRDSLPDAPLAKGPWEEVRTRLAGFYGS
ncbi:MAG: helicase [Gemmatimonadota bacterium]|nr:helicase [Gemmatimonadota bacterium]